MANLKKKLKTYRKEGSEKFAALTAAGNAVRNFSDVKRENSAEEYDIEAIDKVAIATVDRAVDQSVAVYEKFANSEDNK